MTRKHGHFGTRPRAMAAVCALAGALALTAACSANAGSEPQKGEDGRTIVTLALDWTPNTNHAGFFVAQSKGFYRDAGIEFQVVPYGETSPEVLVGAGKANCGIGFARFMPPAVTAGMEATSVMAILQRSPAALAVLEDSGITSPSQLDGKLYGGSGGLPGEYAGIKTVIKSDGGSGDFDAVTLNTGAYESLEAKRVDFVEIYTTWQAIQADLSGVKLRTFIEEDFGIPRAFEVLMDCGNAWLEKNPELARKFVEATVKGWEWTQENPAEAAEILIDENEGVFNNEELVTRSMAELADGYLTDDNGQVGCQSPEAWEAFVDYLAEDDVFKDPSGETLKSTPDATQFYSNDYLPEGQCAE